MVAPRKDMPASQSPECVTVTLCGKRAFACSHIKDLEMRRSSWVIWLGPKSSDKCPCMRQAERQNRTGHRYRGEGDVKLGRGMQP